MRTSRHIVDYALQRKALLAKVRSGLAPTSEVCDANPYLLRAARFHGTPTEASCPICRREQLTHVSWVYGDQLGQASGSARAQRELADMAAKYAEFSVYVVEVCSGCGWNHLVRSYVLGTGAVTSGKQRRRTAGQ